MEKQFKNVTFVSEDSYTPKKLFDSMDYVLVSPGICLLSYQEYLDKILTEFDLFKLAWTGKIIAVTGTVGKTSVTHLLGTLLQSQRIPVLIGGNIGTGMLDLCLNKPQDINQQACIAVLELSSFQLEHVQKAAPDIAVITNIYPNHLDRHRSFQEYCAAKARISTLQNSTQVTLMPEELKVIPELSRGPGIKKYFSSEILKNISVPPISYPINWAIIYSVLEELQLPAHDIISQVTPESLELPHHRLEPIATYNTVTWYNDSKSTVPEATYMALSTLKNSPVILIAGGISKGVDRSNFLTQLPPHVQTVILFGAEATQLAKNAPHCPIIIVTTLQEAVLTAHTICPRPGTVLFSPGGASFDLFANYTERGEMFATCVRQLL